MASPVEPENQAVGTEIGAPRSVTGPVELSMVIEYRGCTVAASGSTVRYRSTASGPGSGTTSITADEAVPAISF